MVALASPRRGVYTSGMKIRASFRILAAMVLVALCGTASAQWLWVDKDGHKVFSDRSPPPDIPDGSILKRPNNSARSAAPAPLPAIDANAVTAAAGLPVPGASAAKPSTVDKDLEAKKKQLQEAEAAKKKAEQDRITAAKADNCERARANKNTLDSGQRIMRTTSTGEHEFMDDNARAAEAQRLQSIINSDCS